MGKFIGLQLAALEQFSPEELETLLRLHQKLADGLARAAKQLEQPGG
jgi:hypothetical protein